MRWYWILNDRIPFNSDEAVVGLMGRHILAGERPVFFYGQAYMGSLDAWLNALGFSLFGSSILTMRGVQTFLWVWVLVSAFFLAKKVTGSVRAGWWTVFLMSFPPVGMVLYSTASLGGYNEAFILGLWSLYVSISVHQAGQNVRNGHLFLLGFICGLGLWAFGFSVVFSLPALMFALYSLSRYRMPARRTISALLSLLTGGLLGASPWLGYALQYGFTDLLGELAGSAVSVETGGLLSRLGTHLVGFFLLGVPSALGFRPTWSVQWLLLPLIPFVLYSWGWLVFRSYKSSAHKTYLRLITSPILLLFVTFVFSSFGVDPSGRYFLPITLLLPVIISGGLVELEKQRWFRVYLPVVLLVVFHLGGAIQAERLSGSGLTTQFAPQTEIDHSRIREVTDFLEKIGEKRGYSTYWIGYPAAFYTNDQVILIPRLPYHQDFRYTVRDDRYDPYTSAVEQSNSTVLVTYDFPALDQRIRELLTSRGIVWQEQSFGKYTIFYALDQTLPLQSLENLYNSGVP